MFGYSWVYQLKLFDIVNTLVMVKFDFWSCEISLFGGIGQIFCILSKSVDLFMGGVYIPSNADADRYGLHCKSVIWETRVFTLPIYWKDLFQLFN